MTSAGSSCSGGGASRKVRRRSLKNMDTSVREALHRAVLARVKARRMQVINLVRLRQSGQGATLEENAYMKSMESEKEVEEGVDSSEGWGWDMAQDDDEFASNVRALSQEDYEDMLLFIEEALMEEQEAAEAEAQGAQAEEIAEAYETDVVTLAEWLDGDEQGKGESVLCPCCRSGSITLETGTRPHIACKCGMDVAVSAGMTLELVRNCLGRAFEEHKASGCNHSPVFFVEGKWSESMLWYSCDVCRIEGIAI